MMWIERSCDACPVQYEGQLDDGAHFYFRERAAAILRACEAEYLSRQPKRVPA